MTGTLLGASDCGLVIIATLTPTGSPLASADFPIPTCVLYFVLVSDPGRSHSHSLEADGHSCGTSSTARSRSARQHQWSVRSTFACSSSLRCSERSACGREAGPAALPARAAGSLSSGLRALRTPPHRIGPGCRLGKVGRVKALEGVCLSSDPRHAASWASIALRSAWLRASAFPRILGRRLPALGAAGAKPGPSRALPFAAPCPCRLLRLVHGWR